MKRRIAKRLVRACNKIAWTVAHPEVLPFSGLAHFACLNRTLLDVQYVSNIQNGVRQQYIFGLFKKTDQKKTQKPNESRTKKQDKCHSLALSVAISACMDTYGCHGGAALLPHSQKVLDYNRNISEPSTCMEFLQVLQTLPTGHSHALQDTW